MIFYICIILLLLAIIGFDLYLLFKCDYSLGEVLGFMNIIAVIVGALIISLIGLALWGVSNAFMSNATEKETYKKETTYLTNVDLETLNGREFYIIFYPNGDYGYAELNENGSITPRIISGEIPIFEDEEVSPYLKSSTTTVTKTSTLNIGFLLPEWFMSADRYKQHTTSTTYEIHVPTKSVKYYLTPYEITEQK